jgi:hypothetical protein
MDPSCLKDVPWYIRAETTTTSPHIKSLGFFPAATDSSHKTTYHHGYAYFLVLVVWESTSLCENRFQPIRYLCSYIARGDVQGSDKQQSSNELQVCKTQQHEGNYYKAENISYILFWISSGLFIGRIFQGVQKFILKWI